jgi:transcriptional regulator with XRE-family HTH domain
MPKQPIRTVFASRLRAARAALGLSQAELGARVGIPEDVASTRVNRYERGVHEPDLATAEALAEELGIPLPALVARDDGLALLIAGFAALPQAKQKAILGQLESALGAKKAEEIRAQLDQTASQATSAKTKAKRRL